MLNRIGIEYQHVSPKKPPKVI